jgi:hypothetical protein
MSTVGILSPMTIFEAILSQTYWRVWLTEIFWHEQRGNSVGFQVPRFQDGIDS